MNALYRTNASYYIRLDKDAYVGFAHAKTAKAVLRRGTAATYITASKELIEPYESELIPLSFAEYAAIIVD